MSRAVRFGLLREALYLLHGTMFLHVRRKRAGQGLRSRAWDSETKSVKSFHVARLCLRRAAPTLVGVLPSPWRTYRQ